MKQFYIDEHFPKTLRAWNTYLTTKKELYDIFDNILKDAARGGGGVGPRAFTRSPETDRRLFDQQKGLCPLCNNAIHEERLSDTSCTHIDHIVPYSRGGPTEWANAQLVHESCNKSKGNRVG